jgi:gluconate 5-dehydrogenase
VYPLAEWQRILDLNLTTTLLACQAAARRMIPRGGGKIVNISSVRSLLGIHSGYSAYCAAKGAVNQLTKQLATEWAEHGITVNAIAPTFIRTEQVADMLADRAFYESLVRRIPLGRVGEVNDLVGATLLLTSPASRFITGQVLFVDGGLTACQ